MMMMRLVHYITFVDVTRNDKAKHNFSVKHFLQLPLI